MELCGDCIRLARHLSTVDKDDKGSFEHTNDATRLPAKAQACKLCDLFFQEFVTEIVQFNDTSFEADKWDSMAESQSIIIWWIPSTRFHIAPGPEKANICILRVALRPPTPNGSKLAFDSTAELLFSVSYFRSKRGTIPRRKELVGPLEEEPSGQIYQRHYTGGTGSKEALDFIALWYQDCMSQHNECEHTISGQKVEDQHVRLPTRLIQITGSGKTIETRLVTTGNQRGSYAALSYCWGPPNKHPLNTTKENIEERHVSIPTHQLPKTFTDALVTIQALGLRYLWIDSLCIIQDDDGDWEQEAARMATVYRNASIVLAASDSTDPQVGIFTDSGYRGNIELPYFPERSSPNATGSFYISRHPDIILPAFSVLGRRAWATQEWSLGRRIVHFREGYLVWSCMSFVYGICDSGYEIALDYRPNKRSGWLLSWDDVVVGYSARGLTFSKDRLPAIQGLADELACIKEAGDYIHGIWAQGLPHQLLWMCSNQPTKYIEYPSSNVPTWSWGSTEGGVNFIGRYYERESLCRIYKFDSTEIHFSCKSRDFPTQGLHSIAGKSKHEDSFAEVKSIEGVSGMRYSPEREHFVLTHPEGNSLGWVIFDGDKVPEGRLRGLQMNTVDDFDYRSMYYGILIVQEDPKYHRRYRRMGVGLVLDLDWFDDAEESEVVLC